MVLDKGGDARSLLARALHRVLAWADDIGDAFVEARRLAHSLDLWLLPLFRLFFIRGAAVDVLVSGGERVFARGHELTLLSATNTFGCVSGRA